MVPGASEGAGADPAPETYATHANRECWELDGRMISWGSCILVPYLPTRLKANNVHPAGCKNGRSGVLPVSVGRPPVGRPSSSTKVRERYVSQC